MLSKRRQRKFLSKNGKEWLAQLTVFDDSGDLEALHRLRVSLKKIKAFVRFAKACSRYTSAKDFRPLQEIFRQAGAIRDANNHLRLLEGVPAVPQEYKDEQARLRDETSVQFIYHIRVYRKKGEKACRKLRGDVQRMQLGCIRNWFAIQLLKTGNLLLATEPGLFHKARRKIKEVLYVQGLLPGRLAGDLKINRKYLDRLQESIGSWHDALTVAQGSAEKDPDGPATRQLQEECRKKEMIAREIGNEFAYSV